MSATQARREARRRRLALSRTGIERREEVRAATSAYLQCLRDSLEELEAIHEREGGQLRYIHDLRASITQVEAARRVMWME